MMYVERKIETSFIIWLREKLTSVPGVVVEKAFTFTGPLTNPTVVAQRPKFVASQLQLGSKEKTHTGYWLVDIYGKTDTQRDDLMYLISEKLESEDIVVLNLDQGFPPAVTPDQEGVLLVEYISAEKYDPIANDPDTVYWLASIKFETRYENITT